MSNVWAPGTGSAAGNLPGGFAVAGEVVSDILKNFGGYLLAGLGMFVAMLPVVMVMVVVAYVPILGAIFAADALGEDLASLLLLAGILLSVVIALGLGATIIAPMQASLMRAMWGYQVRGEPLTFGSAFSTFRDDYMTVVLAYLALQGAVLLGLMFCYVPALIVAFLLHWVTPAVVIHRRSVGEAFGQSFRHAKENAGWTLGVMLVGVLITLVSSYVPLIGALLTPVLYSAYVLKLYRAAFGDGPEPQIS